MAKIQIQLSDVFKKYLKVVGFLLASGVLGFLLSSYVLKDENLTLIFAPAINFIIYVISLELKNEGIGKVLEK